MSAKIRNDSAVPLGRARMQRDRLGIRGDGGQRRLDIHPLGLEAGQPRLDRRCHSARQNAVDDLLDLSIELGKAAVQLVAIAAGCRRSPRALLVVGADEFGQQFRIGQMLIERHQNPLFDMLTGDGAIVVAIAALAVAGAAEPIAADDGVACAATAAFQQATQQMARLTGRGWIVPGIGPIGLAALRGGEQLWWHNLQIRHVMALPLTLGVEATHALAGCRVLDETLAVPDNFAGIEAVGEDAIGPGLAAVDGRRVPRPAARARHALGVERRGNGARIGAGDVVLEDAAHHGGLHLDDLQLPWLARNRRIAIGSAPTRGAGSDARREATSRLLGKVSQIELAHQALEANVHGAHFAILHGHDADLDERELLLDGGEVGLVAAQPVERLAYDDIESARAGIAHQAGEPETVDGRRAGDGGIFISGGDGEALPGGPCLA